ncbi:MAG: ArsA-related P-loop ATPase [Myxococcota bacterium]
MTPAGAAPSTPSTPEAILERRIAVCVGSGGVGKTTLAAAIGLAAARRGRRAVVVTIDPARRLADSLGVGALDNEPRPIPREILERLGVPENGSLCAMMLDMKRTFDDLVQRFAPDTDTRERILRNPIYQHVSDALAGSAEYSAMEKVFEISEREEFELVVLDTPPSQHALDFLEAPERLLEFLDSRLVHVLVHPALAAGRFGVRLFQRGTRRILGLIERVTGIGFLEDISEFLLAFEGMSEGFAERARRVREVLLGPEAAFVLAAAPAGESVAHARAFLDRLESTHVPLAGIVLNRIHLWPSGGAPPDEIPEGGDEGLARSALSEALARDGGEGFPSEEAARAALATVCGYAALVRRDARSMASLEERARQLGCFWRLVPELPRDVHDLEGLARVAERVFDGPQGGEG